MGGYKDLEIRRIWGIYSDDEDQNMMIMMMRIENVHIIWITFKHYERN